VADAQYPGLLDLVAEFEEYNEKRFFRETDVHFHGRFDCCVYDCAQTTLYYKGVGSLNNDIASLKSSATPF
jgi:hypothetical protein